MRKLGLLTILALGLVLGACKGDGKDGKGDDACAPIGVCPTEPTSDPYTVTALAIVDGCLEVEVLYSGGCEDHTFASCWNQAFAESEPVQAWVWIDHDANGDVCKAAIQETLRFDLTPLREAWQDGYQTESGTIVVHVADRSINYSF